MTSVKRILLGLAVTVLIVAGVAAAILVFSSRDGGAIEPAADQASGACQRDGNVTVVYATEPDGIRIDRLAERLGAIDTEPARAGGQAIIARQNERLGGVVAKTTCDDRLEVESATDPQLEEFVRQYLGLQGAQTP